MENLMMAWQKRFLLREYLTKRRKVKQYREWRERKQLLQKINQGIDWSRFNECKRKFIDASPGPDGHSKFLEAEHWIDDALFRAWQLDLHERARMEILDISTGAGYFPLVCQQLGHKCIGTDAISNADRNDIQMYNLLGDIFGLERHDLFIEAYKELPDFGCSFDLVTSYKIAFNNHKKPDQWGISEWEFFIASCQKNLLKGHGEIFLNFSCMSDGSAFLTKDLKEYFTSLNGTVCYSDVWMKI